MPVDGRIRAYYWSLRTFLAEKATILNPEHPDYRFPEDDDLIYYTHHLEGCLVFIDGSRLHFELVLGFDETQCRREAVLLRLFRFLRSTPFSV
jgi:hypothetical protein